MSRKSKAAEFENATYNVTITARHMEITEAMKNYALEKVSKLERFGHRLIDATVTMDIQKIEHRVDIVVKVDNVKLKSQASTNNMYVSIDMAVDKVETQLKKYKDRMINHHERNGSVLSMNVNVLRSATDQEISEVNDDIEEETRLRLLDKYRPHQIVKEEKKAVKTLSDGEAIVKMEQSGDPFMVYFCERDYGLKIMYRRKDGDFGVIEAHIAE